jgi:hypothetical protein
MMLLLLLLLLHIKILRLGAVNVRVSYMSIRK